MKILFYFTIFVLFINDVQLSIDDPNDHHHRQVLINMTRDAWSSYVRFSWGQRAIHPVTLKQFDPSEAHARSGQTIINALSTLWVMDLKAEFEEGRKWLESKFNVSEVVKYEDFPSTVVSYYVGPLLSCYALTKDEFFKNKALEVARVLVNDPVVEDPGTNLTLNSTTNLTTNSTTNLTTISTTISKKNSTVADSPFVASIKWAREGLEYRFLADISGETKFRDILDTISNQTGVSGEKYRDLLGYREKLMTEVKAFIQSNGTDPTSLTQFHKTMELTTKCCFFQQIKQNDQLNLAWTKHITIESMLSSDCNIGAMLALGGRAMKQALDHPQVPVNEEQKAKDLGYANWYQKIGEQITETCHLASNQTATGLPPQEFQIDENATSHDQVFTKLSGPYWLTPYLAESYFTLYRLTRDQKYRTYAWELVESIQKHTRTKYGYSAVENVERIPPAKLDYQSPYFLGATLKYLFLTFDDNQIPLDQWIFTSAGQPLPICGQHDLYPKCNTN